MEPDRRGYESARILALRRLLYRAARFLLMMPLVTILSICGTAAL